jgi:hypothetical protein
VTRQSPTLCYACTKLATTKEHVPPLSFFPEDQRKNLITVPSCEDHNNSNSKDVEYARNIVTTMFGVNALGQKLFADKSFRSFDRSPALIYKTFSDICPVSAQEMTVGAFTIDRERVITVMRACIRALHFRETRERVLGWEIILPNLAFIDGVPQEQVAWWHQSLALFSQILFKVRTTNSPGVFEYATADIPGGRVYAMRLYKSFLVYAFKSPEGGIRKAGAEQAHGLPDLLCQ